jgi:hypothetical protein
VNATISLEGFEELLRLIVREELAAGSERVSIGPRSFFNVESAAKYLDMTPGAVRAYVKRRQLPFHKTPQGRLLFDPAELDAYVRGDPSP